jgi:hypothetical protein
MRTRRSSDRELLDRNVIEPALGLGVVADRLRLLLGRVERDEQGSSTISLS